MDFIDTFRDIFIGHYFFDQRIFSDRNTTDDGGIPAKRRTPFNAGLQKFILSGPECPRGKHIRKYDAWSDEDIVLDDDPFIDTDVVFYFHIVSDYGPWFDEHVL